MVLSPVTFFNGRVDTRRQAQRDSGFFFFQFFSLLQVRFGFFSFELVILFFSLCFVFFGPIFVIRGPKPYVPRPHECVFLMSRDKENRLSHILVQHANGMFECYEFGDVFGFEGLEIQIFCLNKLKELDLAPNPTKI